MSEILNRPLYSLPQREKEELFLHEMNTLTEHHLKHGEAYARLFKVLELAKPPYSHMADVPYLPVGLFKYHDLLSIPREEVFKTLLSSGTTSSVRSKVYLDRQTSQLQTAALAAIMTHFIGQARLPMLIVDSEDIIADRMMYSARGAGILGMLTFGRDPFYVLDSNLHIRKKELFEWARKYSNEPILIFGFTFMVWKHLLEALEEGELTFPQGILIHSGGWKRLQDEAVTNTDFKLKLKSVLGIERCHNFYGMVEQVGSVFMECEQGYFHCPGFAEVIIRDPRTWREADISSTGLVQVLSALPYSYPGHSLLTEDLGHIVGIDDCACGRKGKYFKVSGRVPQAEPRGCSDVR